MRFVRGLAALSMIGVTWAAIHLAQPLSSLHPDPLAPRASFPVALPGEIDDRVRIVVGPDGVATVVPVVGAGLGNSPVPAGATTTFATPITTGTTSGTTETTRGTTATTRATTTTAGGTGTPGTTATTIVAAPVPTTTAPPVAPGGAIVVNPGSNLGTLVSANPPGTAFLIKAGSHVGQSVAPKDGNQFIGEPGAILDGNKAQFAFAGTAANVVIQGLVIEDYNNAPQLGAIHGSGSGWLIKDNEIRYNGTAGVVAPPGSLVTGNFIHHNGQIGLKVGGANVVVDGNEIAFNNYQDAFDMNWEAGGTKFLDTQNLIVRNNYVHDNHGAGLWTDYNNHSTLYEGNVAINNYGPGIFHEISGAAVIRNNRVEGNGHRWYLGGILVANSSGVEVANNSLTGNNGGVMALNQSRDAWVTKNLWVHNNAISYSTGQTGVFAQANEDVIYSAWGNRFDSNTYSGVGASALAFRWAGDKTWDQWRASGMDASGAFS